MPSFPIRPTFPIDVRSPTGSVKLGRQGMSITFDIDPSGVAAKLPPSRAQFFAALEAMIPGATATVQAAVPADPTSALYRAYTLTSFVTPNCALLAFVVATLGLVPAQVTSLLAAAAAQPN